MDINAYFSRIGYIGSVEPNLSTLTGIVLAHASSIPFENLSVLAGEVVSLDISNIEDKLVRRRRGGYCFEQNALLGVVLELLGFEVRQHSARVWYNTPPGVMPPRTHMFLSVTLDGVRWLVDCGVGGSTPTGPMLLDQIDHPQSLPFERRRILRLDSPLVPTFMHQVDFGDSWQDVYEFTGEEMPKIDQEMGNWWTSTYPDSKFRRNLIVALLNPDGTRISLVNREFIHRRASAILERIELKTPNELSNTLLNRFGLELADDRSVQFVFEN